MRSLRRQLTIGVVAALAALLAAGGTIVVWAIRDSLYDQFDAGLRVKALVVVTETRVASGRIRVTFSDRFLREFDDDVATEFFQVFDATGKSIERSDSLHRADLPLPENPGTVAEPAYWNLPLPNGEPGRAIGIRFQPPLDRRDPAAQPVDVSLIVASSRRELDATVAELRAIVAGGAFSVLLVTAAVVPLVLRRALRPLDRMAALATQIDATSLGTRFPAKGLPRELDAITQRLNDLLGRLEASFERERRFSADLAHELRTPLAELRAQVELILKWPEERSAAADQSVLETVLHLEAVVTRLLALARAEQGRENVRPTSVNVSGLVQDVVRTLARAAAAREIALEVTGEDALEIATDSVLLRSIVSNLLENAVAYAPTGSRVVVAATKTGAAFRLVVRNPAPDLAAGDLERMFERLWRGDRARSGSHRLGLGLALSRSFAQLLGLTITARKDGDELEMLVEGPVGYNGSVNEHVTVRPSGEPPR